MKILILGGDGMLGHVTYIYLKEQGYNVVATSRKNKKSPLFFDIKTSVKSVNKLIQEEKPNFIINCIGILNRAAEENKALAILVNSYFPHYLDKLSISKKYKLLHISTDCVFDGELGKYYEKSNQNAKDIYGKSKALGEIINEKNVTLRTSIVGPDPNENGIGLFKWFMDQEGTIEGYNKVIWTGVTTIWLSRCMEIAIKNNLVGLQHCVNNQEINKYDLLQLFKKHFKKDIDIKINNKIESKKTLIRTDKSHDFGIPSYEEMIEDMRDWVEEHKNIYFNLR